MNDAPVDAAGRADASSVDPAMRERARFTVPADHPCLPGHFPGEPVVPGVVLLELALASLGLPEGRPREFAWVKFQRPLLPGQEATVLARAAGAQWRFEVRQGEALLASGVVAGGVVAGRVEAGA